MGLISIFTYLFSTLLIIRLIKPVNLIDFITYFYLILTGNILLSGYILSSFSLLSQLNYWAFIGFLELAAILSYLFISRQFQTIALIHWLKSLWPDLQWLKEWFYGSRLLEKIIVLLPISTLIILGVLNGISILKVAPSEWDSLEYHLPRMAYYIQHSNLANYDANYWAQEVHPKNSIVWMIYLFLHAGRSEKATQLLQYFSYWIAIISVYGIARQIGSSRIQSIFAASIFGLLIETLMEAVSNQNDLVICAFIGLTIYFLFRSMYIKLSTPLVFAAMALGIACGIKSSVLLVMPAVAVVLIYTHLPRSKIYWDSIRKLLIFAIALVFSIVLFTLPAGYLDNIRLFDNPIGPQEVRVEHSFENRSKIEIAKISLKNMALFGLDFLSLDGLKSKGVKEFQGNAKQLLCDYIDRLGINLQSETRLHGPFACAKLPAAHENFSYWGIWGFGFIWIVVILTAFGVDAKWDRRILAISAIVFFISQSLAGLYDPWRGRYFILAGLFAVPLVGAFIRYISQNKLFAFYLLAIVTVGCLSSSSAVILRDNRPLIANTEMFGSTSVTFKSIWLSNRLEQLSSLRTGYLTIIRNYEDTVPTDARVAVLLGRFYEYPLFGNKLTRILYPVNSYLHGRQQIPKDADYLVFSGALLSPEPDDLILGYDRYLDANIYLRKLAKSP